MECDTAIGVTEICEERTKDNLSAASNDECEESRKKRTKVMYQNQLLLSKCSSLKTTLDSAVNSPYDEIDIIVIKWQSIFEQQRAFSRALSKRMITDDRENDESVETEDDEGVTLESEGEGAERSETAKGHEWKEAADATSGNKPEKKKTKEANEKKV